MLKNSSKNLEKRKAKLKASKEDLSNVPIEYLLHDIHSSLTASRHAVWTLKNHRGKHEEIMIQDLEHHIEHALKLLVAARDIKRKRDENT